MIVELIEERVPGFKAQCDSFAKAMPQPVRPTEVHVAPDFRAIIRSSIHLVKRLKQRKITTAHVVVALQLNLAGVSQLSQIKASKIARLGRKILKHEDFVDGEI